MSMKDSMDRKLVRNENNERQDDGANSFNVV